ncbi:hypothetical protein PG991_011225 [Apiospora marii]|uniref:Uncharacterized protein n=1 Tax=Apiospora marii TaxID=335849 RepID=A0ABR1REK3_9PEZI
MADNQGKKQASSSSHDRHHSSSSSGGSLHSDMPVSSEFLRSLQPSRTNYNTPEPTAPSQSQSVSGTVTAASRPAPAPTQKAAQKLPVLAAKADANPSTGLNRCRKCMNLVPDSAWDPAKPFCATHKSLYCSGCKAVKTDSDFDVRPKGKGERYSLCRGCRRRFE